jgi:predicted Fe-Mo cluster-binding NifX family protein/ferredoxin
MKIAVTSTGPTFDDNVEARFGRCAYFLIVDTDTMQSEALENPNIALGGGAGIQSAQLMSEKRVIAILTGNCGPNAFNVFGQAGIQVIVGVTGPVRKAVEQFKAGTFSSASGPNVASHFGMNTSPTDPTPTGQPMTGPLGQGGGMGLGTGGGRGMGRGGGMRRGMGRGRGMGCGRGMGMGAGFGMGNWPALEQPAFSSKPDVDRKQAEAFLRGQAQILEQQKDEVEQKIRELEAGQNLVAVVLSDKCAGCGICIDVCPTGAIEVSEQAVVNSEACTGCAACISECPNEAIILVQKKNSK